MFAGESVIGVITDIINTIMESGKVRSDMTEGIITPVCKNKGGKFKARNHRWITVTPGMMKILDILLPKLIRPSILEAQSPWLSF